MSTHELPVRVYFEDTDAGGIVYHANYLRYAERGRTELLRKLGYHNRQLAEEHGLLFAVIRADLAYLAPARLDDLLVVRTTPLSFKGIRLELSQEVWRAETPLARMAITLALIDRVTLRPKRLADALREQLGRAFGLAAATP